MAAVSLFSERFLKNVQKLIGLHHTIYPRLPPQGMFFEVLIEQAFRLSGWSAADVVVTTPNRPIHDLLVGGVRLSIKSETGKSTKRAKINITKLCTTETGLWTDKALLQHTLNHLNRHDRMLMFRAIWKENKFDHQLVEIPLKLLNKMQKAKFVQVGTRTGRRSIGGDVVINGEKVFHVHFDGADGKCQIHGLLVNHCIVLREWIQPIA